MAREHTGLAADMSRPPGLHDLTWQILAAAHEGNTDRVRDLLRTDPSLLTSGYGDWQAIHFAARAGHADTVKHLVNAGADPLARIWWFGYWTPLQAATDRGHEDVVAVLEAAVERRHHSDGSRGSVVCDAVASGDIDSVTRLLDADPSLVNTADVQVTSLGQHSASRKPIHVAVESGQIDMLALLIARGADVNAIRADGFKPIHQALWKAEGWQLRQDTSIAGYLLASGAHRSTCVAAAMNDLPAVRRAVQADPDQLNFLDTNGRRPLSCAAERGHTDIVRYLLDQGADPNLQERDADRGYALFAVTRQHEHVEIAHMLLEAGADTTAIWNASGDIGMTLARSSSAELCRLLYEHGAVAGLYNLIHEGRLDLCAEIITANPAMAQEHLSAALHQGQLPIARLMMRQGAKFRPGHVALWQTPIAQALEHRRVEIAKLLMDQGEDINWPNWFLQTPLHYVVMCDRPDMVDWALNHGADIDARDWELESRPLAWAAHVGSVRCAEALLERGASVNHPSDQHWNAPLARAEARGHDEVAELLRAAQAASHV